MSSENQKQEQKDHKFQMSEGCKLCQFNINEQCEVAGTPDAVDWCPRFVNGLVSNKMTGKR